MNPRPVSRLPQPRKSRFPAELGIHFFIIACIVFMVRYGLENRVQVENADSQTFQIRHFIDNAVQCAAEKVICGNIACLRIFGIERIIFPMGVIDPACRQHRNRRRMIAAIKPVGKNLVHDAVRIPLRHLGNRIIHRDLPVHFRGIAVLEAFPAQSVSRCAISNAPVFIMNQKTVPNQPRICRRNQHEFVSETTDVFFHGLGRQQLFPGLLGPDPQINRLGQFPYTCLQTKSDRRSAGNRSERTAAPDMA